MAMLNRLWVPESTGKCGCSSKAPIPWFHLHSTLAVFHQQHAGFTKQSMEHVPWKPHGRGSCDEDIPHTPVGVWFPTQRVMTCTESKEFQLSNFTRRLLGVSITVSLHSAYPRLNGTQPIPNRPAEKPFCSPDNAVITTTRPFCCLAKFRSTGHREKKSHSTWSSETWRYSGLFLSPADWAELKTDKSEVKTPLEGSRCKLSFMWLGET